MMQNTINILHPADSEGLAIHKVANDNLPEPIANFRMYKVDN